ncbi:MAG: conjugative transposon protein TraM, partial [Bacteroidetes bacterium]|nr:conjugative transposon protein TraM [Bacteroidota bacterium]
LVLPFVIIFFAALGGGKGHSTIVEAPGTPGINLKLPDAHFKKGKERDKLGLYEEVERDSAILLELKRNDPAYKSVVPNEDTFKNSITSLQSILQRNAAKFNQPGLSALQGSTGNNSTDENEKKIMQKLAQLKAVVNKKESSDKSPVSYPADENPEISKAENMMRMLDMKGNAHDQDLDQLSSMLDKVIMVQHPEKLQDSMQKLSEKNKGKTYIVSNPSKEKYLTLMDKRDTDVSVSGFYGLDQMNAKPAAENAIKAIVPQSTVLVSGATVKLRLLSDVLIAGIKIPKDEFIYGTASLNNERLKIAINSVCYKNYILPVSLDVYDLDGMEGIYIPGSINRDVSKQSADDAVSSIGLTTLDPSIGAQAANAGIQAAKTLMSKKIKLVRVTLKEGYKVLLKDNNQK